MDKDITKTTFYQLFEPIFQKKFLDSLLTNQVDKYVKKLTTTQLIQLFIFAQLNQHKGLREISNQLNNDNYKKLIVLESISPA